MRGKRIRFRYRFPALWQSLMGASIAIDALRPSHQNERFDGFRDG